MLRAENEKLVARQTEMFGRDLPLSKRWDIACDYLDEDLESGYVRVLNEMTAAGWSNDAVGVEVRAMFDRWTMLLTDAATRSESDGVGFDIFSAEEVAALISAVFIGAESMILLGRESEKAPFRKALRTIGQLIRRIEEGTV